MFSIHMFTPTTYREPKHSPSKLARRSCCHSRIVSPLRSSPSMITTCFSLGQAHCRRFTPQVIPLKVRAICLTGPPCSLVIHFFRQRLDDPTCWQGQEPKSAPLPCIIRYNGY